MVSAPASRLKARDEAEGEAALTPRSRRPKTSPRATAPETVEAVLRLRKQLAEQGLGSPAPTAAPAPTWRSSPGSTTTPATPCRSRRTGGSPPASWPTPSPSPRLSTATRPPP
ncbi:leucine zipper domain-containing protein [Pseudonocardia nigra]|uniref:leucine zipper domain-containing protein n=1 Tax=Pseudonocardia nigra TaxID=1921578 RepID=UPI001C5F1B00